MRQYNFTENWFGSDDVNQIIDFNKNEELHLLEIGSFEGRSTIWFLENVLLNPKSTITCIDPWTSYSQNNKSFESYGKENTEWNFKDNKNLFLHNISESGYIEKVIIKDGFSYKIIPELIIADKKYDIVYIDGNHTSPFVLTDAVMSWYVLKDGGIMIFDDYLWRNCSITDPKPAIDTFVHIFSDYSTVTWTGFKKAIKKTKN